MVIKKGVYKMVKVLDYNSNFTGKSVCTLFADTKSEVSANMVIVNLPDGVVPDSGSSVITASGDIALLDSEGNWNFIE